MPAFAEDAKVRAWLHPPAKRQMVVGEYDWVIPHLVEGSSWKTTFLVTNLDTQTAYASIYFFNDKAETMALPLSGRGDVYSLDLTLAPNQSVELETPGTGTNLIQGSALMLTFDRSQSDPMAETVPSKLGGYAIFRQRVSGRPDFEAVVPLTSLFESKFTMFFDNRDGYSTGVAIFNGGDDSSPITLVARDSTGSQLLTASFTVDSVQKLVFSVPERYPLLRGRSGILQFSTTNSTLSGLGLRFNPGGAFTSTHTLSLP